MQIEARPPFRISRDDDGAWHAVSDGCQVTVTADAGVAEVNHRVGQKPATGEASRWLHAHLKERGLHLFVHGTHVVVTARDYRPTFELENPAAIIDRAMRAMRAERDEKGRYVVDTPANRAVLAQLAEHLRRGEKSRLLGWVRHAVARLAA